MRPLVALVALLWAAFMLPAHAQYQHPSGLPARNWDHLSGKPLQDPFSRSVISTVVRRFSILPRDVNDELFLMVVANRGGRPGTLCKGQVLAGMSFGNSEVWDQPVIVVWSNIPEAEQCKPVTIWEVERRSVVYGVMRVHACQNLGAPYPRGGALIAPPTGGPVFGLIPQTDCPPQGGVAACC